MLDGWRFCPICGEAIARTDESVECPACGFVLYSHSAVTASVLPEDGDRVLLARRGIEPFRGSWDVIGGFIHEGEHPLDGLRREVREETGLGVEVDRLLGIWMGDYAGRSTLNLFWVGRLAAGEPQASDDVAELRWFARDALPPAAELAFDGLIAGVLDTWAGSLGPQS
jgi:ADP-ribose pyrophosphatase YjhB (NUDIX family)